MAPTFAANDTISGRYRIVRFLAQGGMGEVYEAEDLELRMHVALKTISTYAEGEQQTIDRFKREIALARRVTHPNVCRIFDLGQHVPEQTVSVLGGPVTFLTMELLHGETLADRLRRVGRLGLDELLPIAKQVCAALAAAHAAGVVHRDLKSENIFVEDDATTVGGSGGLRAVVTDFGVARGNQEDDGFAALVTGAGVVGTPAYMAPEQVEGGVVTPRADLYALGVVLYEGVTGKRPFTGGSPLSIAVKRLKEAPVPPHTLVPELDPRWEKVILRCLERSPEKRYASAEELAAALDATVASPAMARPATTDAPPVPPGGPPLAPTAAMATATSAPRTTTSAPLTTTPTATPTATPLATPTATPTPTLSGTAVAASARAPARRRPWLLLALLAVLAGAAVWWNLLRDRAEEVTRQQAPRRAVAVLGLSDLGEREEDAWLATALAEMLSTELARGGDLRTVPGETVARIRQELALPRTDGLEAATLSRVHSLTGCDYVVLGSYLTVGGRDGTLRLDVRLQDAMLGSTLVTIAEEGSQEELFAVVGRVGSALRERLDADAGTGSDGGDGLPRDRKAARLYAEGLELLRQSTPLFARQRLEEAARIEPGNPLIQLALSTAWASLGYQEEARAAAERALARAQTLDAEHRLLVEGRFHETVGDWAAAAVAYRGLWQRYPDDIEYGLRLLGVQLGQRQPEAALRTVAEMRRLASPSSEDPRIDLAEAQAHGLNGHFEAQLEAAVRGAERAAGLGATLLQAEALVQRAQIHRVLGQGPAAEASARQALALYRQIEHPEGAARALTVLANARFDQSAFEEAATHFEEVLAGYRSLGNTGGMAATLNNQAMVAKKRGDLPAADRLYRQAADLYEQNGNRAGEANTLNNVAAVHYERGDLTAARQLFERSRDLWAELGNPVGEAYGQHNVAVVLRFLGELEESKRLHEDALAKRREMGHRAGEAASLHALAAVLHELGALDEARATVDPVLVLAEELGDRSSLAHACEVSGRLWRVAGRFEEAEKEHRRALTLREELGETRTAAETRLSLARLALERGEPVLATIEAEAARDVFRTLGRQTSEARAAALLARAQAYDDNAEARRLVQDAEALIGTSQQPRARLEVALDTARARTTMGELAPAREALAAIDTEAGEQGYGELQLTARLAQAETLVDVRPARARDLLLTVQSEAGIQGFAALAADAERLLDNVR